MEQAQAKEDAAKEEVRLSPVKEDVVNATAPRLDTADTKHTTSGNPHPKHSSPAAQRKKERHDRLTQAKEEEGNKEPKKVASKRKKVDKPPKNQPTKSEGRKHAPKRHQKREDPGPQEERKPDKAISQHDGDRMQTEEHLRVHKLPKTPKESQKSVRSIDMKQIPVEAKLKCRYRQSCYASIPASASVKSATPQRQSRHGGTKKKVEEPPPGHLLSAEQKQKCKYRLVSKGKNYGRFVNWLFGYFPLRTSRSLNGNR